METKKTNLVFYLDFSFRKKKEKKLGTKAQASNITEYDSLLIDQSDNPAVYTEQTCGHAPTYNSKSITAYVRVSVCIYERVCM